MNIVFWVGILAAVLTTSAFVPQVIKAAKTKETKDISLWMYILLLLGLALWVIYGVACRSLPVIFANSVTLLLCVYLLCLKIKYG
jgi:MtN3 and saliva related transmembrane protein